MNFEKEQLLIDIIQHYPFLYDKSAKDYKDNNKKSIAWDAIASGMASTVDEIQRIWKLLREKYAKERRVVRCTPSGSEAPESSWPLYRAMGFMEKHIATIKRATNVSRPSSSHSMHVLSPLTSPLGSPGVTSEVWDSFAEVTDPTVQSEGVENAPQVEETNTDRPSAEKKICLQEPSTSRSSTKTRATRSFDQTEVQVKKSLNTLTTYLKEKQKPDKNSSFGQYVGLTLGDMPEEEQNYKK